ncbi:probable inactive peptidyl-prolyl cis-trans isomerase-like 6 [Argonauta hians]
MPETYLVEVYGLIDSMNFKRASYCAQRMHTEFPTLFLTPKIVTMFEFQWEEYLDGQRKNLRGEMWVYDKNEIVFINDKMVGSYEDLLYWADGNKFYVDDLPFALFSALVEEDYRSELLRRNHDFIYMYISINGKDAGIFFIELFNDILPRTCQNFKMLCLGSYPMKKYPGKRLTYENSIIHRIVPNGWIQGGDVYEGRGNGGESIYGGEFEDEGFSVPFNKRGILGMANHGRHTNSSQFFITLVETPWMNRKFVAFGQLLEGTELLQKIEEEKTFNERPKNIIEITKCEEFVFDDTISSISTEFSYDTSPGSARKDSAELRRTRYRRKIVGEDGGKFAKEKEDVEKEEGDEEEDEEGEGRGEERGEKGEEKETGSSSSYSWLTYGRLTSKEELRLMKKAEEDLKHIVSNQKTADWIEAESEEEEYEEEEEEEEEEEGEEEAGDGEKEMDAEAQLYKGRDGKLATESEVAQQQLEGTILETPKKEEWTDLKELKEKLEEERRKIAKIKGDRREKITKIKEDEKRRRKIAKLKEGKNIDEDDEDEDDDDEEVDDDDEVDGLEGLEGLEVFEGEGQELFRKTSDELIAFKVKNMELELEVDLEDNLEQFNFEVTHDLEDLEKSEQVFAQEEAASEEAEREEEREEEREREREEEIDRERERIKEEKKTDNEEETTDEEE